MNWTEQHDAAARKLGWRLAPTIDNGDTQPYWMVADAGGFNGRDDKARTYVMNNARLSDALAIAALRAVAQSRVRAPGRKT